MNRATSARRTAHGALSATVILAGLDESFASPRFPEFGVSVQGLFEDVPIERPVLLTPPQLDQKEARLAHSLVSAMVYRPAFP